MKFKKREKKLEGVLKVAILHGCLWRFLNWANCTKSHKASYITVSQGSFILLLLCVILCFYFRFFCSYLGKCRKVGTRNNSVSGHLSRSHGLTQARTLIPRVLPESLAPPSVQRYVIVLRT